MKSSILALALAASLSGHAFAQQATPSAAEHNIHHPQTAQERAAPPTGSVVAQSGSSTTPTMPMSGMQMPGGTAGQDGQRPGGMMSGMQSGMAGQGAPRPGGMMPGMAQGMMSCPMMQGGMAGMRPGAMQMGQPRGDQSVGSLAMNAVNERMHREMMMEYTGNLDADFARSMVAHHQGAIDMAKIVAAFGKDSKIRELAQNIIKAQEDEITMMKSWLAENAKQ